jgi:hypothetical protein
LVEKNDSISFNPDALIKGIEIFWQPKKKYGTTIKKKTAFKNKVAVLQEDLQEEFHWNQ